MHIRWPLSRSRIPHSRPRQSSVILLKWAGWKDCRPSWIQVVPMLTESTFTTEFKCYEPPVNLSMDEVQRLKMYGGLSPSPVLPDSSTMPPFPPGGSSAAPGVPDTSSLGKYTVPGSGSSQHPSQDSGYGRAAFGAGGSSALQALMQVILSNKPWRASRTTTDPP